MGLPLMPIPLGKMTLGNKANGPVVIPTRTLIAILLQTFPWSLTAVLWIGKWLTYGQWPGKHKEWIALGVSAVLSVYFLISGDAESHKGYWPAARRGAAVAGRQAVLVVLVVVSFGIFATWLIWW